MARLGLDWRGVDWRLSTGSECAYDGSLSTVVVPIRIRPGVSRPYQPAPGPALEGALRSYPRRRAPERFDGRFSARNARLRTLVVQRCGRWCGGDAPSTHGENPSRRSRPLSHRVDGVSPMVLASGGFHGSLHARRPLRVAALARCRPLVDVRLAAALSLCAPAPPRPRAVGSAAFAFRWDSSDRRLSFDERELAETRRRRCARTRSESPSALQSRQRELASCSPALPGSLFECAGSPMLDVSASSPADSSSAVSGSACAKTAVGCECCALAHPPQPPHRRGPLPAVRRPGASHERADRAPARCVLRRAPLCARCPSPSAPRGSSTPRGCLRSAPPDHDHAGARRPNLAPAPNAPDLARGLRHRRRRLPAPRCLRSVRDRGGNAPARGDAHENTHSGCLRSAQVRQSAASPVLRYAPMRPQHDTGVRR